MQRMIAFLRAVMPTGPNRIPKMSYLAEIISKAGYGNVKTYIQSGNILLDTDKSIPETAREIHDLIAERIGADLKVIVKTVAEVHGALAESSYQTVKDGSCVFFAFYDEMPDAAARAELQDGDYGEQRLFVGSHCIHMWLPWDAKPKRLSNTYLEKKTVIPSTMRNRNVVEKLFRLSIDENP